MRLQERKSGSRVTMGSQNLINTTPVSTVYRVVLLVLFGLSSLSAEDWSGSACKTAKKRANRTWSAFYLETAGFGGVLRSMGGQTTSEIKFTILAPEVLKARVCELKEIERLSIEQADATFSDLLEPIHAGLVPVSIQVKNRDNRWSFPTEYGADATESRGVFLQAKENPGMFLRESKEHRQEVYRGYSEWANSWQGTALVAFFPYDEKFFQTVKQVVIEIRYGGREGSRRRRANFPKKAGGLLIEQFKTVSGK